MKDSIPSKSITTLERSFENWVGLGCVFFEGTLVEGSTWVPNARREETITR